MRFIGIALVLLGMAGLLVGGIGYDRQRTILDLGVGKVTTTERRSIPIAPIAGAVMLAGGVVLLALRNPRRA